MACYLSVCQRAKQDKTSAFRFTPGTHCHFKKLVACQELLYTVQWGPILVRTGVKGEGILPSLPPPMLFFQPETAWGIQCACTYPSQHHFGSEKQLWEQGRIPSLLHTTVVLVRIEPPQCSLKEFPSGNSLK